MGAFSTGGGAGGASKLSRLRDVRVGSTIADNAVLVYSTATGAWGDAALVSGTTLSLQGLSNVTLSNPSNHQLLIFDGSSWGNGLIGSNNISAGAVNAAAIGAGAVVTGKIAAGAVTANTIASNAVGSAAISAGAVGYSELNVEAGAGITVSDNSGALVIAAEGVAVTQSATAPSSPSAGDLWFRTTDGALFTYYDSAWTEAGGGGAGATTLSGLSDVADSVGSISSGQILIKGTGSEMIPASFSGSGVSVSGATITITAGTGSGATTLSGLTDVASSVGTASTAQILSKGTGSEFVPTTISAGSNVTIGTSTEGVITINATATQGTGSFNPSDTDDTITSADKIAIWHDGTAKLNTIEEMEIDFTPFHLSKKIFSGYRYRAAALNAKGQVRKYTHSDGGLRIQVSALDDDFRALRQTFTPEAKFSYYWQNSRFELVVLGSVQVASNTINLLECTIAVSAQVGNEPSTDQAVSIGFEGKALLYGELSQSSGSADRDAMIGMSRKAITEAIPAKATDQQVQEGSAVSAYATPDQLAAERRHIEADMTWTGYTWQTTGPDGNTNKRVGEDDNIDLLFQFVDSQTNAQAQDALFHPGDILTIRHDDSNLTRGRVQYADARALGSNWVFEAKLKDDDDLEEIGSLSAGDSVSLVHESELHNQIINNMVATQAEAEAGAASTKLETPQRVTQWFNKKVQIGKFTTSDGFTLASSGSDLAQDRFWFQSGAGNNLAGRLRGGSTADTTGLRNNLDGPHDLYFQNGNEWIFARMNGAATEVDGSTGNSGVASNKEFQFTINEHRASTGAASATGAWSLTIYGDLPAAMEEIVPPFAFTPHVIKPGNHNQVMTSVNGRTEWAAAAGGGGPTLGTEITLSGSNDDITGIPAGTRSIEIMVDGLSSSNNENGLSLAIGDSGGVETSGYDLKYFLLYQSGNSVFKGGFTNQSSWFFTNPQGDSIDGLISLRNMSGNKWLVNGQVYTTGGTNQGYTSVIGTKTLSGTLTQLRLIYTETANGGKANILYQ